jgi:Eukaryotic membrane protein family
VQDLAERFAMLVAFVFVVGEDCVSVGALAPSGALVRECGRIFAAEVLVDAVKHTFLAKFNDIRPGVYREFFRRAPARPRDAYLLTLCFS